MIDKSTREIIHRFIRANYKLMTVEQIEEALRKVILMDLHHSTVRRLVYEVIEQEGMTPKRVGRPKKLG